MTTTETKGPAIVPARANHIYTACVCTDPTRMSDPRVMRAYLMPAENTAQTYAHFANRLLAQPNTFWDTLSGEDYGSGEWQELFSQCWQVGDTTELHDAVVDAVADIGKCMDRLRAQAKLQWSEAKTAADAELQVQAS